MSGAILGVAAIGAIGAGASSFMNASSAASAAQARVPSEKLIQEAAGTVPKAAKYTPVNFSDSQLQTIWNNSKAAPYAEDLSSLVDKGITKNALQRITSLSPGYTSAIQQYGANANALLKGQLPFSDLQSIVGNDSAQAASLGIPGGAVGPTSLKDLGLSQLSGMQMGGSMLQNMVSMADQVSPTAGYMTPQSQLLSPADQIQNEMNQNQIIQQSDQNANNLAAEGDPAARLQLGLQVSGALSGASGQPSPAAAGISSGLSSLLGSLGGSKGLGVGGGTAGSASGGLLSSLLGGSSTSAASSASSPSISPSVYSNWAPGPQSGTYYMPQVSYYGGTPGAQLQNYSGS